jgi:hypothetical protein
MTERTITFEEQKFKELLLYVAGKCAQDPKFGATKLNKILFFSDFLAYAELGKPITGATYQRLDRGPAPRQLLPILRAMNMAEEAKLVARGVFKYQQQRLIALRPPNLNVFSSSEIALIDSIIETFRDANAAETSLVSHLQSRGWQLARPGEEIPYCTAFLSCDPPSEEVVRRGRELAAEHGWTE